MKLTADLIYEAALDDALFSELPLLVAAAMDARSCVLHWRHQDGAAEISTHSGYFSDAQMANYAANFVAHDLWTDAGMRQGRVNRAWRTADIVPSDEYEQSIFFNEWIRAMGDDTFYCCGSVMQTVHGHGIIGLHRGKTQGDFSSGSLRQLNAQVGHLRRMFAIRGRISNLTERRDLLAEIFQSAPCAAIVVNGEHRVMAANEKGDAVLRSGDFLRVRNGQIRPALDNDRAPYEQAVALASAPGGRQASECLLRSIDGRAVIASLMPLSTPLSRPAVLMTLDEQREQRPRDMIVSLLQSRYGLSRSEADIALRLADGQTIRDISDERRSTIATVRTQVKQIFSKMHARRQADVIRAVGTCLG